MLFEKLTIGLPVAMQEPLISYPESFTVLQLLRFVEINLPVDVYAEVSALF